MTTTAHTPGPWRLRATALGSQGDFFSFKVDLPNGAVAFTSSNDDASEANARLIAASPSLLSAARLVIERWVRGDLAEAVRQLGFVVSAAEGGAS